MATRYVVLELVDDDNGRGIETWRTMQELVEAHSADQAIRLAIDPEGTYVAIPAKKWQYRGPGAISEHERLHHAEGENVG